MWEKILFQYILPNEEKRHRCQRADQDIKD